MWATENRARYDRSKLRSPSGLTDDEWRLIEALIPPAKRGGNTRTVDVREVVNGLTHYGPGSPQQRHNGSGSPSSDTAQSRKPESPGLRALA